MTIGDFCQHHQKSSAGGLGLPVAGPGLPRLPPDLGDKWKATGPRAVPGGYKRVVKHFGRARLHQGRELPP